MPVKRRSGPRRIDPAAEAEMWATKFKTGCDFFGDLRSRVRQPAVEPSRRATHAAWKRLGRYFYTSPDYEPDQTPWAEQMFGKPD